MLPAPATASLMKSFFDGSLNGDDLLTKEPLGRKNGGKAAVPSRRKGHAVAEAKRRFGERALEFPELKKIKKENKYFFEKMMQIAFIQMREKIAPSNNYNRRDVGGLSKAFLRNLSQRLSTTNFSDELLKNSSENPTEFLKSMSQTEFDSAFSAINPRVMQSCPSPRSKENLRKASKVFSTRLTSEVHLILAFHQFDPEDFTSFVAEYSREKCRFKGPLASQFYEMVLLKIQHTVAAEDIFTLDELRKVCAESHKVVENGSFNFTKEVISHGADVYKFLMGNALSYPYLTGAAHGFHKDVSFLIADQLLRSDYRKTFWDAASLTCFYVLNEHLKDKKEIVSLEEFVLAAFRSYVPPRS